MIDAGEVRVPVIFSSYDLYSMTTEEQRQVELWMNARDTTVYWEPERKRYRLESPVPCITSMGGGRAEQAADWIRSQGVHMDDWQDALLYSFLVPGRQNGRQRRPGGFDRYFMNNPTRSN